MLSIVAGAVLLDMDGTLVDSTAVVERLWVEWSQAHDVDPVRTLGIIHGRQGHESMALLLPDRPHEHNVAENGVMLKRETLELDGVVEIPGADALLAQLAGSPHALVTSATRELAAIRMRAAGVRMPDVTVCAEHVRVGKPDPEGFLTAARLLRLPPASCVVVEDSANGIEAGLAAGMRVIGVGPNGGGANPTWAVPTIADISAAADGQHITLTLNTPR